MQERVDLMGNSVQSTLLGAGTIDIIQCVVNSLILIVAIASAIYAYRAYKHQKDRAKKDAAIALARYYSECIIDRYSFVSDVFRRSGLVDKIKELFPYTKLEDFTYKELCDILESGGVSLEEAIRIFKNVNPFAIYERKVVAAMSPEERQKLENAHISFKVDENGESYKSLSDGISLQNELSLKISQQLNDLEWFSMSCRYGLADEEMLYQSLHKTFLSQVWYLYFFIAFGNVVSEDKLFTSVIWLFNVWKKRLIDIQKQTQSKRDKVEADLEALRKKKESVESPVYTGDPLK